jgi:hypothetical protein
MNVEWKLSNLIARFHEHGSFCGKVFSPKSYFHEFKPVRITNRKPELVSDMLTKSNSNRALPISADAIKMTERSSNPIWSASQYGLGASVSPYMRTREMSVGWVRNPDAGNRGKSRGSGAIIRFSRRRESDSLRACHCPRTLTVFGLPS